LKECKKKENENKRCLEKLRAKQQSVSKNLHGSQAADKHKKNPDFVPLGFDFVLVKQKKMRVFFTQESKI
jgi:hypothetical protein